MILKWAAEYGRLDIIEEVVELGAEHGYVGAYTWMSHCEKIDISGNSLIYFIITSVGFDKTIISVSI